MSELSREDFDRLVAAAAADGQTLTPVPIPEFEDADARHAWCVGLAAALAADGIIVDDPEERELAVALVESRVPLSLTEGSLLRTLLFASLSAGCLVVEVGIDATGRPADLAELGAGVPDTQVAPFECNGLAGYAGLNLGLAPGGGDAVLDRAYGVALAAVLRDLGGETGVPVRAVSVSTDTLLLVESRRALQEYVTSAELAAALEAVLRSIAADLARGGRLTATRPAEAPRPASAGG